MGNFWRSFGEGWSAVDPASKRMTDYFAKQGLKEAWDSAGPTEVETPTNYNQAMGLSDTSEQGARLLQDEVFGKEGYENTAASLNSDPNDPTLADASAVQVKKQHKLGSSVRDTPFTEQEITAAKMAKLADYYGKQGDTEKAVEMLAKAQQYKSGDISLQSAQQSLDHARKMNPQAEKAGALSLQLAETTTPIAIENAKTEQKDAVAFKTFRAQLPLFKQAVANQDLASAAKFYESIFNSKNDGSTSRLVSTEGGKAVYELTTPAGSQTVAYTMDQLVGGLPKLEDYAKSPKDLLAFMKGAAEIKKDESQATYYGAAADDKTASSTGTGRYAPKAGVQQARWDATQLSNFKKSIAEYIPRDENKTPVFEGVALRDSLIDSGMPADTISSRMRQLRAENPDPAAYAAAARRVMANMQKRPEPTPAPAPVPQQNTNKPPPPPGIIEKKEAPGISNVDRRARYREDRDGRSYKNMSPDVRPKTYNNITKG